MIMMQYQTMKGCWQTINATVKEKFPNAKQINAKKFVKITTTLVELLIFCSFSRIVKL